MPAQQLPISLIGSMWNLRYRRASPEEEGYVEEESAEVGRDARLQSANTSAQSSSTCLSSLAAEHTHLHATLSRRGIGITRYWRVIGTCAKQYSG